MTRMRMVHYHPMNDNDCTRCPLRKQITRRKGTEVGGELVHEHFKSGTLPLVLKYDREFATPEFESLLLSFKVVSLPSPPASPTTNGKHERSDRPLQQSIRFSGYIDHCTDAELEGELDFCFHEIDAVAAAAILKGITRRKEYHPRDRATVYRNAFFEDAAKLRREILSRPGNKVTATSAWWGPTK